MVFLQQIALPRLFRAHHLQATQRDLRNKVAPQRAVFIRMQHNIVKRLDRPTHQGVIGCRRFTRGPDIPSEGGLQFGCRINAQETARIGIVDKAGPDRLQHRGGLRRQGEGKVFKTVAGMSRHRGILGGRQHIAFGEPEPFLHIRSFQIRQPERARFIRQGARHGRSFAGRLFKRLPALGIGTLRNRKRRNRGIGRKRQFTVGAFERLEHLHLWIAKWIVPASVVQGRALLRHHADAEKGGIANQPFAVQQRQRRIAPLRAGHRCIGGRLRGCHARLELRADKGSHIARIKGADAVGDVVIEIEIRIIRSHAPPGPRNSGIRQMAQLIRGKRSAARFIARHHGPAHPCGGSIRKDSLRKARKTAGYIAHVAVIAIPHGTHHRREPIIVIRSGQRSSQHHQKGPDHGDAA